MTRTKRLPEPKEKVLWVPPHKWKCEESWNNSWLSSATTVHYLWVCTECEVSIRLPKGEHPTNSQFPNCHEEIIRKVLSE